MKSIILKIVTQIIIASALLISITNIFSSIFCWNILKIDIILCSFAFVTFIVIMQSIYLLLQKLSNN